MILHLFTCLVSLTVVLARTEHYFGLHGHMVETKAEEEVVNRNRRSTADDEERLLGLTKEEHDLSLHLHNYYRRKIPASNMQKMSFNLPLAEIAYNLTQSCYMRHWWPATWPDSPIATDVMGQNLYAGNSWKLNITFGMAGYYDEKENYNYETNAGSGTGGQYGHYTQLVWGDSSLMGCAYSFCPDFKLPSGSMGHNFHFYACNYAPGGNINTHKPYKEGPACSECDATNAFWCDTTEPRGLCANNEEQLAQQSLNGNIVCAGASVCRNGGVIGCDCMCKCALGFRGRYCEQTCQNKNSLCGGGYPASYCDHKVYKETMEGICPMTCGLCGTASPEQCDFPTVPAA